MPNGFDKSKFIAKMHSPAARLSRHYSQERDPAPGIRGMFGMKDESQDNPKVASIERISGTKYGTEEYFQWLDDHPMYNLFGSGEQLNKETPPDPYRVSEETKQIYESTQEAGGIIRGQAQEAVDVAETQRGMIDTPGGGLQRQAAEESTAAAVSSAQVGGGASTSALGAIAQIQQGNISSMRDAAIQTQVFRDQAEQEYIQALREQGGAEISAIQTEIQGIQEMGKAKEQQYQTMILDPYYLKQQGELTMAAAKAAKPDNKFLGIF